MNDHLLNTTNCRKIHVTAWLFWVLAFLARAQPALQITSPADGAVVNPGQTISVTVSTTTSFSQMTIIAPDPIGFSQVLTAAPYQFSIQVPSSIKPGRYMLTASGVTTPGAGADSAPISIDIERPGNPVGFQIEPSRLEMETGDKSVLNVVGIYEDGSHLYLNKSTQTIFTSQSPAIATVSASGLVTAIAPGVTQIAVNNNFVVPVTVNPPVRIVPEDAILASSQSRQFVARVGNNLNTNVIWSVSSGE